LQQPSTAAESTKGIDHSADITGHLRELEFDPTKTAYLHEGMVRAYPPIIPFEVAVSAMAAFYTSGGNED
jgi:hypothetical protein